MVFNERAGKGKKNHFKDYVFLLKFDGIIFVGSVLVTRLISSHIIPEWPITLSKYLPFSQVYV